MSKQIISEEFRRMQKLAGLITESQLNEDNLEVKRIAKDLYQFLKKIGANVRLMASVPSKGTNSVNVGANRDDSTSDNGATVFYWDDQKTSQTVIEIHLTGDEQKIQEVEKKLLSTYPGLEQYNRNLMKGGGISTAMKYRGTDKEGTVSNLVFRVKEKNNCKRRFSK
jgi:hypothetical protein